MKRIITMLALLCLIVTLPNYTTEKKVVFITGTGRCGTSCVAGVLKIMGLKFGAHLIGPTTYNQRGVFEDKRISRLCLSLFKKLGMHRHRPKYHIDWDCYYEPFKEKIKDALQRYFDGFDMYAIKHPYISYLLPAFIGAARELEYTPKLIIVLRHPQEIVQSYVEHSKNEPIEWFYQLVGTCLMSLVEFCQHEDVLIVHYDDLLQKPEEVVGNIHAFLPELATYKQVRISLVAFIDRQLKHQIYQQEEKVLNSAG